MRANQKSINSRSDDTVINVYTDGACKGNPGRGGWGWVEYHVVRKGVSMMFTDCGGRETTTNNKMELEAVIKYLEDAPKGRWYCIYSDSQYVLKGLVSGANGSLGAPGVYNGWIKGWIAKDFANVKSVEYWRALDTLLRNHLREGTRIDLKYVKGHSGNKGNDMADSLANRGVP